MEYPASDECIIILQIFQFFVYSGVNSVILPLEGRAQTIYFASVCTSQCCIIIYPKSDILYDISAIMSDICQKIYSRICNTASLSSSLSKPQFSAIEVFIEGCGSKNADAKIYGQCVSFISNCTRYLRRSKGKTNYHISLSQMLFFQILRFILV